MSGPITLQDLIARETPEVQAQIEVEYRKLLQRVEDLRAIREIAGVSQTELARKMETDQGGLSRIERKADIALRTLRRFVEEIGGELDIVVRLPGHPPMRLEKLSDSRGS